MMAKVSDYSATGEAKRLVNELLQLESRGAGDLENAMKRLAHRYGLPWRVFWTLKYRNPKDVLMGTFKKLEEAHLQECRRQMQRMGHAVEMARARGVMVDDLENSLRTLRDELADSVSKLR